MIKNYDVELALLLGKTALAQLNAFARHRISAKERVDARYVAKPQPRQPIEQGPGPTADVQNLLILADAYLMDNLHSAWFRLHSLDQLSNKASSKDSAITRRQRECFERVLDSL